jgi:hypothetical protein
VSQQTFQASLARLVLEPNYRELIRSKGEAALGPGHTRLERRRLVGVAADPGLDLTAYLVRSFRLGKLLTLLPLTRTLMGSRRFAEEAQRFWDASPPSSFYFLEEALGFCDHVLERVENRALRVKYLDEVVAYERAMLELRRVRADGDSPEPQRVRFRHDPAVLLESLAAGRRPRGVAERRFDLVAAVDDQGDVQWYADEVASVV